jgi:hypothetical protein
MRRLGPKPEGRRRGEGERMTNYQARIEETLHEIADDIPKIGMKYKDAFPGDTWLFSFVHNVVYDKQDVLTRLKAVIERIESPDFDLTEEEERAKEDPT